MLGDICLYFNLNNTLTLALSNRNLQLLLIFFFITKDIVWNEEDESVVRNCLQIAKTSSVLSGEEKIKAPILQLTPEEQISAFLGELH